jgi:hypothetical protein
MPVVVVGGGGGVVLGGGPELEAEAGESDLVVEAACVLAVAGGGACRFLAPAGLPSQSSVRRCGRHRPPVLREGQTCASIWSSQSSDFGADLSAYV